MEKSSKITKNVRQGYQEPEWLTILKNLIKEVREQKSQNATTPE
jgi:hypothetical protein